MTFFIAQEISMDGVVGTIHQLVTQLTIHVQALFMDLIQNLLHIKSAYRMELGFVIRIQTIHGPITHHVSI